MTKVKVEFNKQGQNQFYGMQNCLSFYQNASKGNTSFDLDACWKECKTKDQKALFFALCMSVGDITARQHNVFKGNKVESGGYAEREIFRDRILPWMWKKVNLKSSPMDPVEFLALVIEFTVTDNIIGNRVKTQKGKTNITQVINQIDVFGIDVCVQVCKRLYNGTDFQKTCLAKFLTLPQSRKNMQPQTLAIHAKRRELIKAFCDECNIPYAEDNGYFNPTGYKTWRKKYNANFESVLFSTGSILKLDQESFLNILNAAPASARHRIKRRLMDHNNECKQEKYASLCKWYLGWENHKEGAQAAQREIEEKVRQGTATAAEKTMLKQVKKDAKVTVGAVKFAQLCNDIILGTADRAMVQPFLDLIKMDYNTLVIMDTSGSMGSVHGKSASRWGNTSKYPFSPLQFASFVATICLLKNPDDEARSLLAMFDTQCHWFNQITTQSSRPNRFMQGLAKSVKKPLLDPNKHFIENFQEMTKFIDAKGAGGGTNVSSIAQSITSWMAKDEGACIDALSAYPLWIIVSDGEFNNRPSNIQSLGECFKLMENKVGIKPYVLIIDVADSSSASITNFDGMDNVMMVPPNLANLEQVFTNFKDIDTYDVYTPLLTLSRSKRYAAIRKMWGVKETVSSSKEEVMV